MELLDFMEIGYGKRFAVAIAAFLAAVLLLSCSKPESGETNGGNEPDGPEVIEPEEPDAPSVRTYKVGDFYSASFVKGIVVGVDEKGEHGLLVSLNETEAEWTVWAYRNVEVMGSLPGTGAYNTSCVQNIKGWKDNFPAFRDATSGNVGTLKNWFLPSMNELATLYRAYTGHETNDTDGGTGSLKSDSAYDIPSEEQCKANFNKLLQDNGGKPLADAVYWSSNESGPSIAYAFDMSGGKTVDTPSDLDKMIRYHVRAMASF